jgi:hypothetical protein
MFWQFRPAVQEIAGRPMNAEQLFRAVVECGDQVQAAEVVPAIVHAIVERDGERIVMRGASGSHSLAVLATDAERLLAHWTGFKEIAEAEARRRFSWNAR